MSRKNNSRDEALSAVKRFALRPMLVAAFIGCLTAMVWAQDSNDSNSSLGDLARQSRAHHATAPDAKSNKAQELVDEMQAEQEASDNAPLGFKNYDAGDYRVFVPFPFSLRTGEWRSRAARVKSG